MTAATEATVRSRAAADKTRDGAMARLRNCMVLIRHAECFRGDFRGDKTRPAVIEALVRSTRDNVPPHEIVLHNDGWTCTCRGGPDCVHIRAVRMVTGWWTR